MSNKMEKEDFIVAHAHWEEKLVLLAEKTNKIKIKILPEKTISINHILGNYSVEFYGKHIFNFEMITDKETKVRKFLTKLEFKEIIKEKKLIKKYWSRILDIYDEIPGEGETVTKVIKNHFEQIIDNETIEHFINNCISYCKNLIEINKKIRELYYIDESESRFDVIYLKNKSSQIRIMIGFGGICLVKIINLDTSPSEFNTIEEELCDTTIDLLHNPILVPYRRTLFWDIMRMLYLF